MSILYIRVRAQGWWCLQAVVNQMSRVFQAENRHFLLTCWHNGYWRKQYKTLQSFSLSLTMQRHTYPLWKFMSDTRFATKEMLYKKKWQAIPQTIYARLKSAMTLILSDVSLCRSVVSAAPVRTGCTAAHDTCEATYNKETFSPTRGQEN